jgi:UDP-N-acetylglucosamine acyltransferase
MACSDAAAVIPRNSMIHSSALVSPSARLAPGVTVGPFAIVEDSVEIGEGSRIGAHAQVLSGVRMGARNVVDRGAVIGGDPQSLSFDRTVLSGVTIGDDNTFREHVTVHRSTRPNSATVIGCHNFIMATAHVGHDAVIGDHNVIANGVLIAGHVTIGSRCFFGGGAGIHQFIRIGDFAMVQGNGSVSQDVPPYCILSGLNEIDGINVIGLRRAGFDNAGRLEIKRAWSAAYQSSLGPVKGAAAALESGSWSDAAQLLLGFIAATGSKGIACPRRQRSRIKDA